MWAMPPESQPSPCLSVQPVGSVCCRRGRRWETGRNKTEHSLSSRFRPDRWTSECVPLFLQIARTAEVRREPGEGWGKRTLSRGRSRCKGPEARRSLAVLGTAGRPVQLQWKE